MRLNGDSGELDICRSTVYYKIALNPHLMKGDATLVKRFLYSRFTTLFILILAVLLTGAAQGRASNAAFTGQAEAARENEVIHLFDVTASVEKDGFVTITERIELTALGREIKRGIVRKFPTDYAAADGRTVRTGFELISAKLDGEDVNSSVERKDAYLEIRLGSSNVMLDRGRHVYEIIYKTRGWIAFREKFDEFYWNVTGNEWTFPIEKAAYRVVLPEGGVILKSAGFTGYKGDKGADFKQLPDGSFQTTRYFRPGEGLTVTVAWEKGLVEAPSLPLMEKLEQMFYYNRELVVAFFIAATALYYAAAWLLRGRDEPMGAVIPLFSPPGGVEAGYVKYFTERAYSTAALAANILQLAVAGAIRFSGGANDLKILRTEKQAKELKLQLPLKEIYKKIPAGGGMDVDESNGEIFYEMEQNLKSAYKTRGKEHFASNISLVILGLIPLMLFLGAGSWLGGPVVEFFDSGGGLFTAIMLLMLIGFAYEFAAKLRSLLKGGIGSLRGFEWVQLLILVFLSLLDAALFGLLLYADPVYIGGVAAASGIACFFSLKIMSATTKEGARMAREIRGLAMYIGTAERHRLPMINPPDETPQLFEKLLPYAFALGLAKTWADSFSSILEAAGYVPEWSDNFTDTATLSALVYGISDSISDSRGSYSAPSESSSYDGGSGFDGGSSGGGGGGGGGSGW